MGTRLNRLCEAVHTSTHNLCFEQKNEKYQIFFYLKIFIFGGKIFIIFEEACFRNVTELIDEQNTLIRLHYK